MNIPRKQLYAYAAIAVVVAAVGVRAMAGSRAGAATGPVQLVAAPSPVASAAASTGPTAPPPVVVYVCGAVHKPGVYTLDQGARIADAIAAAGGAGAHAELGAVNLAARVTDGQQVIVPERGAAVTPSVDATGAAAAGAPSAVVNLNTASAEELDTLQGVGPSTAQKIIDYRTANGGFKSIDELKNIPGIGDVRFAALKDHVSV
jgi:competence protein ComEA